MFLRGFCFGAVAHSGGKIQAIGVARQCLLQRCTRDEWVGIKRVFSDSIVCFSRNQLFGLG